MNEKTKKIIGWVLSGLLGALFVASAAGKLSGSTTEMMGEWGFGATDVMMIGVLELVCAALFLVPRTIAVGTLLLCSYMGGALATHMQHGDPYVFQAAVIAVVWVASYLRNPAIASGLFKS